MTDYRITKLRLQADGPVYTPVVSPSGQFLGPAAVEALAATADPTRAGQRVRRVRFVLADESRPRFPESPPGYRLEWVEYERGAVPLTLGEGTGLVVGRIESVEVMAPGATPGTEGSHALAVAMLSDTILADVVWRAIQDGVLDGVCAEMAAFVDRDSDLTIGGELRAVGIGDLGSSCLPGARVLAWWEEPAALPDGYDGLILRGLRALERVEPILRDETRRLLGAAAYWAETTLARSRPDRRVPEELVPIILEDLGRLVALALIDASHAQHPERLALRGLLREVGDATAATDGQPGSAP
jgi:hypothetical protein